MAKRRQSMVHDAVIIPNVWPHVLEPCPAYLESRLEQACLLNIFKKLKAKKTQPLKKLKGIFGQKTQCIGIFEALSNKLSVLEFFEASFSPLF